VQVGDVADQSLERRGDVALDRLAAATGSFPGTVVRL
jgi:hypothetical protein